MEAYSIRMEYKKWRQLYFTISVLGKVRIVSLICQRGWNPWCLVLSDLLYDFLAATSILDTFRRAPEKSQKTRSG
jgi:hypothetical protein